LPDERHARGIIFYDLLGRIEWNNDRTGLVIAHVAIFVHGAHTGVVVDRHGKFRLPGKF
jgi:hypothetical protein